MPGNDATIDFDKLASALEQLAAKPNPKAMTKEDYLRQPKVYASLKKAWEAGYRSSDIVPILAAEGFEIAAPTFEIYWRRIRKEMGDHIESETAPKQTGRAKTTKSGASSAKPKGNPSGEKTEPLISASNGSSSDRAGGKALGKQTDMGGAFRDDV